MLSLNQIALRRGTELLFENVDFTLHQGRKVGLVGNNGTGKTSLFKLILGELETDHGDVEISKNLRIAHLAQEVEATDQPALDYVLSGDAELIKVQENLEQAEKNAEFDKIAGLYEKLDALDGYTAKTRAEQLLTGLGFAIAEFNKPLSGFSGGWRIRLNLARTLMTPSDLLLLDEPTNHLDLDTILWLVSWIKRYPGSMLVISHDREFLDDTVTGIAYIQHKQIELLSGNYSQFEIIKAARLSEQQSSFEKQQREIKHMQDFVRRFKAKATKARQAQSRIKALERMEVIAPAHIDSPFQFRIPVAEKFSDPLLSLDQAALGYGEPVLHQVRFNLHPGDRVGLLGHNGAGKSTLIKSLCGETKLLQGARHEGANLRIGYFSQHQVDDLDLEASSFLHLRRQDPKLREQEIRNYLGGFDFHGDKIHDKIRTFSGGEKARLALAMVAHRKPNLLLLDEPTNHLDMEMRQALTIALQDFEGAILLISHDRHLLANTVDSFLLVADGRVTEFDGDLEDYRQRLFDDAGPEAQLEKATAPTLSDSAQKQVKKPGNHKEARQLRTRIKTLEALIERLQGKLRGIETELASNETYESSGADKLQNLLRDQLNLNNELNETEEEWLEKSDRLEAISG